MIQDRDRSNYFGASDTSMVVGNRKTKTFKNWWCEKLGIGGNDFSTKAMKVGNAYEHRILEYLGLTEDEMDLQIIIPELHFRVNYDGVKDGRIYEVKTYKADEFKVSKQYWRQAQAEMLAYKLMYGKVPELRIVAYRVTDDEYENYFKDITDRQLTMIPVSYDPEFTNGLVASLKELGDCLDKGVMPK